MDTKIIPSDFRKGRMPKACDLNFAKNAAFQQVTGAGVDVQNVGSRLLISMEDNQIVPGETIYTYSIISESTDNLICAVFQHGTSVNTYDATLGATTPVGEQILIAKPYLLQTTPWNGQVVTIGGIAYTYTYLGINVRTLTWTVSGVSYSRTEAIYPPYLPGDIITARVVWTGYDNTYLEDMNEGGRTWVEESFGSVDQLVLVGSGALNADGMYPGTIKLESTLGTFVSGAACWVEEANGQRLVVGKIYSCKRSPNIYYSDGKQMFAFGSPVFTGAGAAHAPGLVPDPGTTPSAGLTRYLREDATFAVPATPPAAPDFSVQWNDPTFTPHTFGGDSEFTFFPSTKEVQIGRQILNGHNTAEAFTYKAAARFTNPAGSVGYPPTTTLICCENNLGCNILGWADGPDNPLGGTGFFGVIGGNAFFEETFIDTPDVVSTVAQLNGESEVDGGFVLAAGRFQWYRERGLAGGSGYSGPGGEISNRALLGLESDAVRSEGPLTFLGHLKTNQLTGADIGSFPETYLPIYDRYDAFVGYIPVYPPLPGSGGPPPPPPPPLGSGSGSIGGSGGIGGGVGISSVGLWHDSTTGASTLSSATAIPAGISMPANSLLIVGVNTEAPPGSYSISVTYNGVAVTAGPTIANLNTIGGLTASFTKKITTATTGHIVVTITGGASDIAACAIEVDGLTNFTVDASITGALGSNPAAPPTLSLTVPNANTYIQGIFFIQVPASAVSWLSPFINGGQNQAVSGFASGTLTEGYRIVTFSGTFSATIGVSGCYGWTGILLGVS